jgi:hypothetical protein
VIQERVKEEVAEQLMLKIKTQGYKEMIKAFRSISIPSKSSLHSHQQGGKGGEGGRQEGRVLSNH